MAVSPLRAEFSREMTAKHDLTFPQMLRARPWPWILFAAAFGLRYQLPPELQQLYAGFGLDLPRFNGDASWTLPIPARYVVDAEGVIRDVAVSADYRDRPDPEETLAILRRL